MTEESGKTRIYRVFVIGPIKEEGSEERKRSDKILNKLIKPAVLQCGFEEPV